MYNKLFTKILDSSVWLEPHSTRIVWLTLLAAMDQDGMCHYASVANLARRAIVSIEEAREAITVLETADVDSSDPDNDGRRIERVPGGWLVLNAPKYREAVTAEESRRLARERQARWREKRRDVTQNHLQVPESNANVTPICDSNALRNGSVTQSEAVAVAETNASTETKKQKQPQAAFILPTWINPETWGTYLEVRASKKAAKTPGAWNAVVKQLAKFANKGYDPNEILENSIRGNWIDVYEPKGGHHAGKRISNHELIEARRGFLQSRSAGRMADDAHNAGGHGEAGEPGDGRGGPGTAADAVHPHP